MSRIGTGARQGPHPDIARPSPGSGTMRVVRGELAVDVHSTLGTLFVIAVVAVLAPVCLALLPGPRIPQVVLLLWAGC